MDFMSNLDKEQTVQAGRDTRRTQDNQDELAERIARAVPEDGIIEPLKGLFLYRISRAGEPIHGVTDPAFCVIAQGSKEVMLGEDRFQYDPLHYLLSTVELPVVGQVLEASKEKPYLGLRLQLDSALVASAMVEASIAAPRSNAGDVKAITVSALDASFLDATLRLVRLVDSPREARVLAPLITREIVFRLLMGEQGARLRHIAVLGGHTDRVAQAIERLRHDYDKPLSIEGLAKDLGMSLSGFHNHFKAVTAMSPLQFQKHLRLQEARRLMLGEDLDAASAGYRVGYDDASHFNREYKRLFGEPPMRDVERLRESAKSALVA
ncbi:MAG: AraC family transcriptional regulator [Armatimonadota bacterium]